MTDDKGIQPFLKYRDSTQNGCKLEIHVLIHNLTSSDYE